MDHRWRNRPVMREVDDHRIRRLWRAVLAMATATQASGTKEKEGDDEEEDGDRATGRALNASDVDFLSARAATARWAPSSSR